MPTHTEYAGHIRKSKPFKGISEDLLGNELAKVDALGTANAFLPLAVKSSTRLWTPLQWRGGDVAMLIKSHTGAKNDLSNRRDVTMADFAAMRDLQPHE